MSKLQVIELITGQKLLGKKLDEAATDQLKYKEMIWMMQGVQGQFNLVPYTALGNAETTASFEKRNVICAYELDNDGIEQAYNKAWSEYKTMKSGIVTPSKPKLDLQV